MAADIQTTVRFPEWVLAKLDKVYENCYQVWLYTRDPSACKIVKLAQEMAERYQVMRDELPCLCRSKERVEDSRLMKGICNEIS